jgi:hypothetical protein
LPREIVVPAPPPVPPPELVVPPPELVVPPPELVVPPPELVVPPPELVVPPPEPEPPEDVTGPPPAAATTAESGTRMPQLVIDSPTTARRTPATTVRRRFEVSNLPLAPTIRCVRGALGFLAAECSVFLFRGRQLIALA